MSTIIEEYLESIRTNLRLETPDEKEVITELATHIEDEVQDLKKKGLRDEDAINTCIKFLGSAKSVARMIYEAHSQGSWKQALMSSLPHLLFGLIFILNWWKGIVPVLIILLVIFSTTVYVWWRRRKSNWLFPWLGYSLFPVIAAGLSLLYLPTGLAWLAIIVYIPLALWLIIRVIKQTIKKDWLYLSLMLLPMPMIMAWFAVTEWPFMGDNSFSPGMSSYQHWIGISFLALALGVISFVRIRRRWLKISVLFLTGVITLILICAYAWWQLSFINFILLLLLLCSIFLIPALLDNSARAGRWVNRFDQRRLS